MTWASETDLKKTGESTFSGFIGDNWASLQGAHGGVVAGMAVKAASQVLLERGVDPSFTMRVASFGYVSGNSLGDVDFAVEIVRTGRTMVNSHVTVSQNGKTTTVSRLIHAQPLEGVEFSDIAAPPAVPTETRVISPGTVARHFPNVDHFVDSETSGFINASKGEWKCWGRPKDENTFDAAWLAMYADFYPPAVFVRSAAPSRAVTLEYSIHIHSSQNEWTLGAGEYLPTHMHVNHSQDGLAVEDGHIWLPDGTLLASMRQSRLAG